MHQLSHMEEKDKMPCDQCGTRFTTKQALMVHIKAQHSVTTGQKYPYPKCNREFEQKRYVQEHLRNCSENPDAHKKKCPYCGEAFGPKYYYRHLRSVHGWSQ